MKTAPQTSTHAKRSRPATCPGVVPPHAGDSVNGTLLTQYGCGPIHFTEADTGLYDRHLLFDNVLPLEGARPRERFEAFARSVRDVLSQRWVRTEQTYERGNPKRVYYLSMEFLIGRSLDNNVINLLLEPIARHAAAARGIDPMDMLEQEPDAGLGNGGLGRLAACFLDSMATMQLPAMGYGLRRAGVLPGRLFAGGPGAPLPPQQCGLGRAAAEGRHAAQ